MAVLNDDVNQLERFLDVGANQMILTISNVVFVGLVFFVISPELAFLAFLPIPVIVVGSLLLPEEARAALRRRAGGGRAHRRHAHQQPRRHRHHQGLHRRGARGGAGRRRQPGLRRGQRRGDPLSSAFIPLIRMAILAGFTVTLVVGGRRRPQRRPRGGPLRHARVHDPAAALAAHRARRDARPLPAGHGLVPADLRAARPWSRASSPARATCRAPVRGAVRFDDVHVRATAPAATSCTASTSRSPPARPTPSWAPPAPARARS